jgi:hypothetical protein
MLGLPAEVHRALSLSDDVPLPPLYDRRTEAMLRRIASDDVPFRKMLVTLRMALLQAKAARDHLLKMIELIALFDQMSFTREQIEAMPDGYRREIIAQRRRAQLRIVEE